MGKSLREVRNDIYVSVREEILGPGSEQTGIPKEEEVITDKPSKRYSTGILFSKKNEVVEYDKYNDNNEQDDEEMRENNSFKEQEMKCEEKSEVYGKQTINEEFHDDINNSHIIKKSTMGMTFFCNKDIKSLKVNLSGARYREVMTSDCAVTYKGDLLPLKDPEVASYIYYDDENNLLKLKERIDSDLIKKFESDGYFNGREELESALYKLAKQCNKKYKAFKRYKINFENPYIIEFDKNNYAYKLIEEEELKIFVLKKKYYDKYSITVMLVNENTQKTYDESYVFQPEISVESKENDFIFESNEVNEEHEDRLLKLLYRNKKNYGTGHGVSVDFSKVDRSTGEGVIKTDYMPTFEVPGTSFVMDEISEIKDKLLSMKKLSSLSDLSKAEVIATLKIFSQCYKEWIKSKEDEAIHNNYKEIFGEIVDKNLDDCKISCQRIEEGIKLLEDNDVVYKAFQLANTAMLIQRIQGNHPHDIEEDESIEMYKNYSDSEASWRGFQLAFILMTIPSIVDPKNKFRDTVDLIWIPTGGGKTEAYLGVSAFTIFHRRMTKGKNGYGTTIIMRYTLRLLAAQQFERASIMICACEFIREKSEKLLGKEPISIGLWIGATQTPNTLASAREKIREMSTSSWSENKFQLSECPWCKEKYKVDSYEITRGRNGRFLFKCKNHNCHFQDSLPVQIIDQCMYKEPPTLLFSTVDKFAMLPWKGETKAFFGVEGENTAPELIIQDELHLISGPLGTLVSLFETSVDYLCSSKGIKPKIIASTATICEAEEQVKNLYNRNVKQFPAPGLEIEDSFFSRESNLEEKDGRLYVGITGIGQTQMTTEIRLFASLLQRVSVMDIDDNIKDKYWTLVSYFNSIRELGKASTLIYDDVKDYMIRMARRLYNIRKTRKIYSANELTSRISSSRIVKTLKDLEINYPEKGSVNIVLATNMISVGVDVPRLNIMTVIGQPKLTSEYIQASSRVGREDPGIVFTLYDGRKSRDDSHYEIFQAYHQAFYKYVEPTSITPYSEPAIDRMLHSAFITMVRLHSKYNKNDEAKYIDIDDKSFEEVISYILDRAQNIDPSSVEYINEKLNEIKMLWIEKAKNQEYPLTYSNGDNPLISTYYNEKAKNKGIPTMTSMRNVDSEACIAILE